MRIDFAAQDPDGPILLPAGFRFVDEREVALETWLRLLNQDGEFGMITSASVQKEIKSVLIPNGAVFVAAGNEIVACASACTAARFHPDALMNYVLVRSDYRGRGLGRAVSREAMRRARDHGYGGMVLQTDDQRESALKMYLSLGFDPVIGDTPEITARWAAILARQR